MDSLAGDILIWIGLMWHGWAVFQAGCAIRDGLYSRNRRP